MNNTISTIRFEALKGATRTIDLKPLTVLTGDNHSGKTAVFDAITLAMNGYIPRLGKTNPATMKLCSTDADAMFVEAKGNGWSSARNWTRSGKTVKTASRTTGKPPEFQAAILEPETFLSAGPKARLEILAGLVGGDEIEALGKRCADWSKKLHLGHAGHADPVAAATMLEGAAKEAAATQRELIKRYTGTIHGVAELGDDAGRDFGDDLRDAQDRRSAAIVALRQLEGQDRGMERADEAAQDAASELAELPELPDDTDDHLDTLEERIAAARQTYHAINEEQGKAKQAAETTRMRRSSITLRLNRATLTSANENGDLTARQTELEKQIAELEEKGPGPEVAPLEQRMREMDDAINESGRRKHASKEARAQAERAIADLAKLDCCPVCMAKNKGWKAIAEAHYAEVIKVSTMLIEREDATATGLIEASIELSDARAAAERQKLAYEGRVALADEIAAIKEYRETTAQLVKDNDALAEISIRLETSVDTEAHLLNTLKERRIREQSKARRTDLQKLIDARPTAEALEAKNKEIDHRCMAVDAIEQEIEVLREKQRKASEADGQRKVLEQAKEALTKAETELADLTALAAEIRAAREEAVDSAYKPIIAAAAAFGEGVIEGRLAVSDGEIGISRGAAFIPVECMSGTEATVLTASIQAGLSQMHGGFLMVDELSRIARPRRQRFVANLENAISAGTLTQAILIDHDSEQWPDEYAVRID